MLQISPHVSGAWVSSLTNKEKREECTLAFCMCPVTMFHAPFPQQAHIFPCLSFTVEIFVEALLGALHIPDRIQLQVALPFTALTLYAQEDSLHISSIRKYKLGLSGICGLKSNYANMNR